MKSPQHKKEEPTSSIVQRLLQKKKLTADMYNDNKQGNKTAEQRRLNEFHKEEKKEGK